MNNQTANSGFKAGGTGVGLCLFILAIALTGTADAQQERVYTRMGGANAISHVYTEDQAALQAEFKKHWPDLKRVLAKGKWDGNPDDLYKAVMDDSYGQVTSVSFPIDGKLDWMAFRWEGRPQVKRNIRWGGAEPFEAWKIAFKSYDKEHVFIVPKVCLNLALYYPPPPPECYLKTSTKEIEVGKPFSVEVSGGTHVMLTVYPAPGGKQPYYGWQTSPYTWTMPMMEAGEYTFKGYARTELGEASSKYCEGKVKVYTPPPPPPCKPKPPVCDISLSTDMAKAGDEFTVDMSGSMAGECMTDGKCVVPKGGCDSLKSLAVVVTDASGAEVKSMNLDLGSKSGSVSLDKRGSYTVKGTVTTSSGLYASCDAGIEIKPKKVWIARPYALYCAATGDGYDRSIGAVDGAGVAYTESRVQVHTDECMGVGIDFEKKFNDRTGFFFGVWTAEFDLDWVLDTTLVWLMGEEDLGALGFNAGFNFHLTPNSKVDFYVGPMVTYAQFDAFNILDAQGTGSVSRRIDYGDEFGFGAQLGVDIPLKDRWAFATGVRYLDLQLEDGNDFKIGLDPLMVTAGFAFTF